MIHSYGIWRNFVLNPSKIRISKGKEIDWDNEEPVSRKEIDTVLQAGAKRNKMLDFVPVAYSDELRPAPKLAGQGRKKMIYRGQRFRKVYYTWVDKDKAPLKFKLKTGQIAIYRKKYGPIVFKLYNIGGVSADGTRETLELTDRSVESDGKNATVVLQPKQTGLYKIEVDDRGCLTTVNLTKGKFVILADGSLPWGLSGSFYFYVPKGTNKIGMFHGLTRGQVRGPDGKTLYDFGKNSKKGYLAIDVPSGMDGKIWMLYNLSGKINLLTVPPYLALCGKDILLPEEIVKKDNLK